MYLTDKKNETVRSREDHEDLEVLLESFAKQVEEIVNEADTMIVSRRLIRGTTDVADPRCNGRATFNPHKRSWSSY